MITCYDLSDGHEPVSYAELDFLKHLARYLPENPVVVNIGAADGLSTVAILEERPDAKIYSIDIEPCPQEFVNVEQAGLDSSRVVRILSRSQDVAWDKPPCDLLFVDGDHWGAAGDIEAWVKTGRVDGIVAFHDFQRNGCAPNNPGSVYEDVTAGMAGYECIGEAERLIAFRVGG